MISKKLVFLNFINFFVIKSIYAESIQIKSDNDLCLSYDETKVSVGYNPVISTFSIYPLITWEACNNVTNDQLFEFNSHDQLIHKTIDNSELCVTPLAVGNSHLNLDPCDIWNDFTGAGTYLFAIECQTDPNIENYQKFSYNSIEQTFISQCSHNFKIGSVLTSDGELRSFLTDDYDSFDSSEIIEIDDSSHNEIINGQNGEILIPSDSIFQIQISQPKDKAFIQVASEFLTSDEFTELYNHGCWCSRIFGNNLDFAGNSIDALDQLCKEWAQTRRCNELTGSTCDDKITYGRKNQLSYTMIRDINLNTIDCELDINLNSQTDDCLKDSCLIDTMYATSISQYLSANTNWNKVVMSSVQCPQGLAANVDKSCSGTAPNLDIEIL